jgi:hypothetical protein
MQDARDIDPDSFLDGAPEAFVNAVPIRLNREADQAFYPNV